MLRLRSFLADRLGWPSHLKPFMQKPLPENLNWSVSLGGILVLLFVVQAATGMFLALYYNPSPDLAYPSVDFIMQKVALGDILRGIHHWGAGAMVVLAVAHMAVVFFCGAFKPPGELTWIVGVGLLLLTLGFGFTGYLLPWDRKAYWATVVGTNVPREIPLVGRFITRTLLGGETVSGLTLTRFYTIHTMLLPALTALSVGAHVYLVRIHGISEPAAAAGTAPRAESSYHFFPEHLFRISVAFAAVFGVVLLLSLLADIPREEIAGTVDPEYLPRPEWYFMWLFQLLTFFPGKLELVASLVIPLAGVAVLFALPFMSRSPLKSPADRPIQTAVGVACLVGIVYLSLMGMAGSQPHGQLFNVAARPLSPSEKSGLAVYAQRDCAYCHHIMGGGGRRQGPDLSNLIAKDRTKTWLADVVKNPQAVSTWSIMPAYDLPPEELDALTDFLLSLDFNRHAIRTMSRPEALGDKEAIP